MRLTRISLALAAVLTLSACTGTWSGMKADSKDIDHWMDGKASQAGYDWGAFPKGYTGQNVQGKTILHPPPPKPEKPAPAPMPAPEAPAPAMAAAPVPAPQQAAPVSGMIHSTNDITVFRISDADKGASYSATPLPPAQAYGQLVQKIYFGYGSSAVSTQDAGKLASFAHGLGMGADVHLTVIGHASGTVKGVKDAARRKAINQKIAKKRADAVARALKKAGVKAASIKVISKGDAEAKDGKTDRRVDVYMK